MNAIQATICPECGQPLERGAVTGHAAGIFWLPEGGPRSRWIFSKRLEKLQKDWWGFATLKKADLPALRCRPCCLVLFRYEG